MSKYVKKQIVVDAVKFVDDAECLTKLSKLGLEPVVVSYGYPKKPVICIETIEGTMNGEVGDYIIKGVNGEFYPCKPNIFEKTYSKVEVE